MVNHLGADRPPQFQARVIVAGVLDTGIQTRARRLLGKLAEEASVIGKQIAQDSRRRARRSPIFGRV
jgi:hypothetical protein